MGRLRPHHIPGQAPVPRQFLAMSLALTSTILWLETHVDPSPYTLVLPPMISRMPTVVLFFCSVVLADAPTGFLNCDYIWVGTNIDICVSSRYPPSAFTSTLSSPSAFTSTLSSSYTWPGPSPPAISSYFTCFKKYKSVAGDTCMSIARQFEITVFDVQHGNGGFYVSTISSCLMHRQLS